MSYYIGAWERAQAEDRDGAQAEDRDLVTRAARAAGLPLEWHETFSSDLRSRSLMAYLREPRPGLDRRLTDCKHWNPLIDDGDALRLAVKLGFISPGRWPDAGLIACQQLAERGGAIDWYAATRRAIVRAAAALPDAMPNVGVEPVTPATEER